MLDLQNRRVQLALFVAGLIALSMMAEKFREIVGEEASSKSGKFTFLNCFDMGSGTVACGVKEGVKLYVYSIRSGHVEKARQRAIERALDEALKEGVASSEAAKQAQKTGAKAAKLASRQAKRILGPIISSGWDFFEAMYYGGSMTEGFLRGAGTLAGTYVVGYHGEQRLGRLGYLCGSHLGSWVGGRIGLMIYDIVNGLSYVLQFGQLEEGNAGPRDGYGGEEAKSYESSSVEESESYDYDTNLVEKSENYESRAEESGEYESPSRAEESGEYESGSENTESTGGWGFL